MDLAIDKWRKYLLPITEVTTSPPKWVLPNVLPPGLTILFGDPKSYKSTFALHAIAALVHQTPLAGDLSKVAAKPGSSAIYIAKEQSAGRLKFIYEKRVIKRTLNRETGVINYNFSFVKDPWHWKLDEPSKDHNIVTLQKDLEPTVLVLDPLIYFHGLDENDPHLVDPIVPLREQALEAGTSVIIVHHARKKSGQQASSQDPSDDFARMRGTSALWGMADAGIMLKVMGTGDTIDVRSIYKDFPGSNWTWRPNAL